MTSIDIAQAFHHANVGELSVYHAFSFNNQTYSYIAMSFGVSLAPTVFYKTLKPVIEEIRNRWKLKAIGYADDIILISKDKK
ncbi:MAG: hypothetical protein EZS28_043312, partial [Streblomastix strix]